MYLKKSTKILAKPSKNVSVRKYKDTPKIDKLFYRAYINYVVNKKLKIFLDWIKPVR